MLLVNSKQLEQIALKDENHPMYSYAVQYKEGLDRLRKRFGDSIRFRRPNYPKATEGVDARGKKVPRMVKPTPPMFVPLKAVVQGEAGMEVWEYCKGKPTLLPNNLWEPTGKRSVSIEDVLTVSLNRDADLAFFLYYKSPFYDRRPGKERKGLLVIDDPNYIAEEEGDKVRAELELQNAIYGVLNDNDTLRVVAQGYGVPQFDKKHPDTVRKELKALVLAGEQKKKRDPRARGIKEFIDDLKVGDAMKLKHMITVGEDRGVVTCVAGHYKCGDTDLCKVPLADLDFKQWYLANYLGKPDNRAKLQAFLKDVVTKEYLDKVTDSKIFHWIARMMELEVNLRDKDKTREGVYAHFVVE